MLVIELWHGVATLLLCQVLHALGFNFGDARVEEQLSFGGLTLARTASTVRVTTAQDLPARLLELWRYEVLYRVHIGGLYWLLSFHQSLVAGLFPYPLGIVVFLLRKIVNLRQLELCLVKIVADMLRVERLIVHVHEHELRVYVSAESLGVFSAQDRLD